MGDLAACSSTRPTSTSIATAASGWPRAFATARITPVNPKATASSCSQDTDGDGKADSSHTFVQEPALVAPLGVSVIDNKIVVAQPPDLIVYTDVDRNLKFDPAVDKREVLLTGFQGINHDHSLHSVTVGPDGKWIFNSGNIGGMFTDKSGKTFRIFGSYRPESGRPVQVPAQPGGLRRQAERRRARLRRRVHGADEPRRHQRGDHRLATTATATSSRSPRSATSSRTTTTTRRLPRQPG